MNEWTNEQLNARMNGWINARTKSTSEWVSDRLNRSLKGKSPCNCKNLNKSYNRKENTVKIYRNFGKNNNNKNNNSNWKKKKHQGKHDKIYLSDGWIDVRRNLCYANELKLRLVFVYLCLLFSQLSLQA